ncbi:MAG: serine/threonine-protein kinase, partial [Acidobacteriota bacterium]
MSENDEEEETPKGDAPSKTDLPTLAEAGKVRDATALPTLTRPGERPDADGRSANAPAIEAESIDGYTLIGQLGRGGMGVVYEAEQHQPRRKVALKVVRSDRFLDENNLRMFQREADSLARLEHPNIANIFESGSTDDGQHYFAMELIRGETLDVWLDSHPPSGARRDLEVKLLLLASVAEAVHYAHQRGVIHRDLKPSNLIVTEPSEESDAGRASQTTGIPSIKILDFGLARITDSDVAATQITEIGVIKGTLAYMSPEQAQGDPALIDVRTDVYALGVMLYELLTGQRPYEIPGNSLMEVIRVIREQPPAPLEEVWSEARRIDQDIQTVVDKALAKDPDMRYGSAAALAEDLRRYLASQPILARPPSTVYQLRKLVARNRLASSLLALLLVSVIGFGILVSVLFARSLRAEARASLEAETSSQALDFMTEMFEVSDPSESRGETITAREILDRGALRIEQELAEQPSVRSALMTTMGKTYAGLGLYTQAEQLIRSAIDARTQLGEASEPATLAASAALGEVLLGQSKLEEATSVLRRSFEQQRELLGPDHLDTLNTQAALVQALEERSLYPEAETMGREAIELSKARYGDEHEISLILRNQLALVLQEIGRLEDAEREMRSVWDVRRKSQGDDHPETLSALNNLAEHYMRMGRFDDSNRLFREGLETMRRTMGREHRDTLRFESNLGRLLTEQHRWDEAEVAYREILEIQQRTLGEDHIDTLMSLNTVGVVLTNLERNAEAESYYLRAFEGWRRRFGEAHTETLTTTSNLAIFYMSEGRLDDAESWGQRAYDGAVELFGADHPSTLLFLENL